MTERIDSTAPPGALDWFRREFRKVQQEHEWIKHKTMMKPPKHGPLAADRVGTCSVLGLVPGTIFSATQSPEDCDLELHTLPEINPDGCMVVFAQLSGEPGPAFRVSLAVVWQGASLEVPAGKIVRGSEPAGLVADLSELPSELRCAWQSKRTWEIGEIPFRFVLRQIEHN
jgi:hypothetical protein